MAGLGVVWRYFKKNNWESFFWFSTALEKRAIFSGQNGTFSLRNLPVLDFSVVNGFLFPLLGLRPGDMVYLLFFNVSVELRSVLFKKRIKISERN